MTLVKEKCTACRGDSPRVTDTEIERLHLMVPEWHLTNVDGIAKLERNHPVGNFAKALDLAIRIGQIAEKEGHHPQLTVEWGHLKVSWWTHKIGGLHRNDFVMAAKTDQIISELSQ